MELIFLSKGESLYLDLCESVPLVSNESFHRLYFRFHTHVSAHRQLVSSYKGKFGYVHYYVKALMERPQQPTLECKKCFEVEEPLDVNTPDLLVSSQLVS